jgi:hypothetical protein
MEPSMRPAFLSLRSSRPLRLVAAIAAAAAIAACASGGSSPSGASATQNVGAPDGRRSGDVLTQSDIERAGVSTAFDAVQRLRPVWLRTRGRGSIQSSAQYAVVYLDGAQVGGPEALRRISATDVRSILYLRAADATTRYGTGHEGGAILVETKK